MNALNKQVHAAILRMARQYVVDADPDWEHLHSEYNKILLFLRRIHRYMLIICWDNRQKREILPPGPQPDGGGDKDEYTE
jgi:hypothetical protein